MITVEIEDTSKHPEEVNRVMDILERESAEVSHFGINRQWVLDLIQSKQISTLIARQDGALIGVIVFVVSPLWYTRDVDAVSDLLVWVHPAHRRGGVFVQMVMALEDHAAAIGAKCVQLNQSTGINVQKTADLYAKMGYRVIGFLSSKEV